MRDFRTPAAGRGKIDKDNVVIRDLVDAIANKQDGGINAHLARAEAEKESRYITVTMQSLRVLIERAEMMISALSDERRKINERG